MDTHRNSRDRSFENRPAVMFTILLTDKSLEENYFRLIDYTGVWTNFPLINIVNVYKNPYCFP